MSIKMKPIAEAAPHEVRSFATAFLNLEVTGSESDAEILALVERAQPGNPNIFVMEDDGLDDEPLTGAFDTLSSPAEEVSRVSGSLGRRDPRVTINIPFTGEDNIGRSDVAVGVNGVIWQIKRGVDVDVPWRVVEALGLTLQDIVRHDMESNEVIITQAMRFPVQFPQGRPPADVIEAWHDATDKAFCP